MLELIKWSDGKKGSWWGYHTPAALGATWLFVGLHAHTSAAEMTLAYSCVSQSKQQHFTSKSASLESGSKTVFG